MNKETKLIFSLVTSQDSPHKSGPTNIHMMQILDDRPPQSCLYECSDDYHPLLTDILAG